MKTKYEERIKHCEKVAIDLKQRIATTEGPGAEEQLRSLKDHLDYTDVRISSSKAGISSSDASIEYLSYALQEVEEGSFAFMTSVVCVNSIKHHLIENIPCISYFLGAHIR